MTASTESFGKWRRRFWPVQSFELKKIIPLLLLKFMISVVYTFLYTLKDTVIVTSSHSSAEVIPVLKGWIILPISILSVILYSKLSNIFRPATLFYGTVTSILGFIGIYAFILYPNIDSISPHSSADWFLSTYGNQFSHWIAIYRNWAHSLFYIFAEMWSSIVIFVLYWGFTNQISSVGEAKRTYTIFIAAGDVGSMLPLFLNTYVVKYFAGPDFISTLQTVVPIVLFFGVLILATFWYLNTYVVTDRTLVTKEQAENGLKRKTKLSLLESVKYILTSRYLLSIAVMVIGCALTINLVEVTWKANVRQYFPNSNDYYDFMNSVTFWLGFLGLLTVLFVSGNLLRVFGWAFSARVTPLIIGSTGVIFFLLVMFQDALGPVFASLGVSPLSVIVFFGAFQFVSSKVVKYSFFDNTKEMVFIPLDQESKTKGKAAIDAVGSRLGKSGSSWLQILLIELIGTGSVLSITPFLMPFIVMMVASWMMAVRYLNKEFASQDESMVKA